MKNSFIKFFLILLIVLNFFQQSVSDDFNFEVSELQIYDDGNLIKGINGGKVTSNNGIVIIANNFEYNKSTSLLKSEGNVKLIDTNNKIIIESNEIFYKKDKEIIYTKGKSKANNSDEIEIFADDYFIYNKLTSLLEAKGNVLINDKEQDIKIETNEFFYLKNKEKFFTKGETKAIVEKKYTINTKNLIFFRNQQILSSAKKTKIKDSILNNVYELIEFEYSIDEEILKGKEIRITTNDQKSNSDKFFFKNGFINFKKNEFLAKDVNAKFHKTLFDDNNNDPRINAVIGYGDEYNTYFEKGIFTSCKKTDKCPPWKISAKKIQHNKNKKQIIYKNAWLEIYDFPVVYFPKFFHPDPTVKRQSGFLTPEIGNSKSLGNSLYMPYFYAISNNKDMTIKPRLFSDNSQNNILVLQNEYRQKTKSSNTIMDFSFTQGHDSNLNDKDDSRSHFFTNTIMDLELTDFTNSILEINYEKTSNDNYLKLFNLESPLLLENNDVLESIIKLDLEHQDFDLTTSFSMYETLNGSNSDRYQYVLPSYNFSKNFNLKKMGGGFNFNSYGDNTLSATNVTTSELSNDLNYTTYNNFFNNGIKTNYEVSLKNTNTVGKNSAQYKESPQSELMSAYIYNASLPLLKNTKKSLNTLEPKISFRLSPHDMKNNKTLERRIDVNNIFNSNRLSMNNSFEGGESVTLGLNFKKEIINIKDEINEMEEYVDFKLATVFRLDEEKNMPTNSTLKNKKSNVFGQLNFKPSKKFSFNYNFSLTENLDTFEYNSLVTKINFNNFTTQFNYLEERGVIGATNVLENTTTYSFNEENSLSFNTRRNRNLNLTEYYDLIYEYKNDCLIAGIKYKKNYYNDADIKPVEELFFTITIVPLTTFSPDKMILK